jgi:hypothetical protein
MLTLLPWLLLLPMPALPMEPTETAAAPAPVVEVAAPEPAPAPRCASNSFTCVDNEDLKTFISLLKAQKCRTDTQPTVTADPITIVVDRQGRVFGSGTGDKPWKIHLDWCNYKLEATTNLHMDVAQRVEPTWGFRLRVKATFGVLGTELFKAKRFDQALDGGIMVEPFFIRWANLNAVVGVRSLGAGFGFDLTNNFGGYLGYALTWGTWRSNPFASVFFAF